MALIHCVGMVLLEQVFSVPVPKSAEYWSVYFHLRHCPVRCCISWLHWYSGQDNPYQTYLPDPVDVQPAEVEAAGWFLPTGYDAAVLKPMLRKYFWHERQNNDLQKNDPVLRNYPHQFCWAGSQNQLDPGFHMHWNLCHSAVWRAGPCIFHILITEPYLPLRLSL